MYCTTLYHRYGSCDENQLTNSSSTPLAPGSTEQYELKDTDVGSIKTVALRLVATGAVQVSYISGCGGFQSWALSLMADKHIDSCAV